MSRHHRYVAVLFAVSLWGLSLGHGGGFAQNPPNPVQITGANADTLSTSGLASSFQPTNGPLSVSAVPTKLALALGFQQGDIIQSINSQTGKTAVEWTAIVNGATKFGASELVVLSPGQPSRTIRIANDPVTTISNNFGLTLAATTTPASAPVPEAFEVKISSGLALQAGIRATDKVTVMLNNRLIGNKDDFLNQLALNSIDRTSVTLTVYPGGAAPSFTTTLPPRSRGNADTPLLTRGISSAQEKGPPVSFPQFLGPSAEPKPAAPESNRDRTRSHETISARVELYYFRDAHRVAQILNRNVKSYNGPAVTQHARAAEAAREQFEERRLDRRGAEAEARQKAAELRQLENDLVTKVGALRSTLETQSNSENGTISTVGGTTTGGKTTGGTTTLGKISRGSVTAAKISTGAKISGALSGTVVKATANGNSTTVTLSVPTISNATLSDASLIGATINGVTLTGGTTMGGTTTGGNLTGGTTTGGTLTAASGTNVGAPSVGGVITNSSVANGTTVGGVTKGGTLTGGMLSGGTVNAATVSQAAIANATISYEFTGPAANAPKQNDLDTVQSGTVIAGAITNGLITAGDIADGTTTGGTTIEGTTTGGTTTGGILTGGDQKGGTNVGDLRTQLNDSLKAVQQKRIEAMRSQAAADRANDVEQNAAKEQFRREVSAAKVDPDTYVPADINSIDPVSQVSISVIGEGVLHLRGPRLGVNKVRYMIDEIDHPVGQVKIGVMTVQVNGENGNRMENTMRRIEGNISLARHMATISNNYFQRALVETANAVAVRSAGLPTRPRHIAGPPSGDLEQPARWQKYIEAFFGDDFLAELAEIDPHSSVLNPRHKLLSLNSMDTITLGEALFITGLAKASVRNEILQRFQTFLECELPEQESQWIITNKIYRCLDPRWKGDAEKGRIKNAENACRRYKFSSILSYFVRQYDGTEFSSETLNPLQREVIKLVQGISLEHAWRAQRGSMMLKRSLIEKKATFSSNVLLDPVELYYLDQQIDELEEKHLQACESLRGQKAALDKLIKSVVIALEDDVYAQFYNPALEKIRKAATEWDVEMSQIERTTILTNNRAFAKVSPQASYEMDLPRRNLAAVEALHAAAAVQKDLGPLLSDPNFVGLNKILNNSTLSGTSASSVKNILPGMPSDTDQKDLLFGDSTAQKHFGTELEKLVPDPAIYKFETGTGFEVRPVVQPDGQSVAFDFNYMYTTDLLEPVRADEKHLGRIKRHFINTEVQLGNLEWREISRYEVALKASRNARGVPLLEDIPAAGVLFRPLPQAKKSLQKNIIIGQASIYPTIQDLLGLKATELCHLDVGQTLCDAREEKDRDGQRSRRVNNVLNTKVDELLSRGNSAQTICPDLPVVPNGATELGVPPTPMGAKQIQLPNPNLSPDINPAPRRIQRASGINGSREGAALPRALPQRSNNAGSVPMNNAIVPASYEHREKNVTIQNWTEADDPGAKARLRTLMSSKATSTGPDAAPPKRVKVASTK